MIKETIEKIVNKIDLKEPEMRDAFGEIMSGRATPAQIGAFVTGLRMKGETVEEITGAAKVMREKCLKIDAGAGLIDTCGTGGSPVSTFNISTAAAFVIAGAGLKVAKHGNRAASSRCGSADVLEALGVKIDAPVETVAKCIGRAGVGFMYAPLFHSAMKHAIGPRREIGVRTIFNILGPLSNPARAEYQLLGVYDARLVETMANALKNLGARRALVVHGMDGLDEITITGRTRIAELKDGRIRAYYVTPEKFGIKCSSLANIKGSSAKENARKILSILEGAKGPGRDIVLMNAGAGLYCAGKAKDFKEGVRLAAESVDSHSARGALQKLIGLTNVIARER